MCEFKPIHRDEIGVGFYAAFGTDFGPVAFFQVFENSDRQLRVRFLWLNNTKIGYGAAESPLDWWLPLQPRGAEFFRDRDRTGWTDSEKPWTLGPWMPTAGGGVHIEGRRWHEDFVAAVWIDSGGNHRWWAEWGKDADGTADSEEAACAAALTWLRGRGAPMGVHDA